eukprot:GILK01006275.1.p1 GENE.GILK01006275.1~~GILK01006275.1.p1  ORF type:complete len:183 (-),score=16.29 GILK01006275.1:142-648(-)
MASRVQLATFGAGCFWGTEKFFKKQFKDGLLSSAVGYMGGDAAHPNPTYEDVCTGRTNHAEVLQVKYDEDKVSYDDLLMFFWRMHDPTTLNRQGNDTGTQYRSVVFFHTPEQRDRAVDLKEQLNSSGKFRAPIITEITPASTFWPGEEYHQSYLERNPGGYCNHRLYW